MDITNNSIDQLLLNTQNNILTMIMNQKPSKDIIYTIIHSVEEVFRSGNVVIYLKDSGQTYAAIEQAITIDYIHLIEDSLQISKDECHVFNPAELSKTNRKLDYQTCLYQPLFHQNQQITLLVFFHQDYSPTIYEKQIVHHFARLASLAFEQMQENLNKEVHQLIENNISDLITIIDLQGTILYASPSHEQLLGIKPNELLGKETRKFLHPKDQEGLLFYLEEIKHSAATLITECRLLKSDGTYIIVESRGVLVPVDHESLKKIVIVSRDITSRKEAEATIKYMAYHDHLTGVPNRRKLKEKMEKLLVECKQTTSTFSLLFVDLDNFKEINDQYGHDIGDFVLVKITERLKKSLSEDCFFARWGGDEFAIMIPSNEEVSYSIANSLIQEMSHPFEVEGLTISVTPSIGISMYPRDGEDLTTLLEKADKAMYVAKDHGKNNVITYHI